MQKFETTDFILNIPKTWKSRLVLTFSDDLENPAQHNVTVTNETIENQPIDVFDYAKTQHIQLASQLMNYQELERSVIELKNSKSPIIHYKWNTGHSIVVQCQVFFVSDDTIWTLTFTCPEKDQLQFRETITDITHGFLLKASE